MGVDAPAAACPRLPGPRAPLVESDPGFRVGFRPASNQHLLQSHTLQPKGGPVDEPDHRYPITSGPLRPRGALAGRVSDMAQRPIRTAISEARCAPLQVEKPPAAFRCIGRIGGA